MEIFIGKVVAALSNPLVIGTLAVILEFTMRLVKSEKPMSIAHSVSRVLAQVAVGAKALAEFMDKVLPQSVVTPVSLPVKPPTA